MKGKQQIHAWHTDSGYNAAISACGTDGHFWWMTLDLLDRVWSAAWDDHVKATQDKRKEKTWEDHEKIWKDVDMSLEDGVQLYLPLNLSTSEEPFPPQNAETYLLFQEKDSPDLMRHETTSSPPNWSDLYSFLAQHEHGMAKQFSRRPHCVVVTFLWRVLCSVVEEVANL